MDANKNIKCPNCGSYATQKVTPLALGIGLILSGCLFFLVPFLGLLLMPVLFILGVIVIILSPFIKEYGCKCKTCKYSWRHNKYSETDINKEFEIGDQVLVFVNDKVKTGIIANIDTKRDDKYMVMFNDEPLNNNHMYFTYDEMSLSLNE